MSMPQRAPRTGTRRREGGFTLLELLVVIFIMLAMTGIAVAAFRQFMDTERIKLAGGQVVSAIGLARQYAMSRRAKVMVELIDDLDAMEILPNGDYKLYICADNSYQVFLNGVALGSGGNWQSMQTYVMTPQVGTNVLAVMASNGAAGPAGLLSELVLDGTRQSPSWNCRASAPTDWPGCTDAGQWGSGAVVNGAYGIAPWNSNVNAPAPPTGTPAQWVWNAASTGSVPAGSVYFRATFNYTPPAPYEPSDAAPRCVRIIPYLRMNNPVTGGFSWLLDEDVNALKLFRLPLNVHFVLAPARATISQYDPGDLVDHRSQVRKCWLDLWPDGTCTGQAPELEGWTAQVNTVIMRDTGTGDVCLLFMPPSSAFTRQRYLFGTEVDSFVAAHSLYSLW